jgi:hypothetical protein
VSKCKNNKIKGKKEKPPLYSLIQMRYVETTPGMGRG